MVWASSACHYPSDNLEIIRRRNCDVRKGKNVCISNQRRVKWRYYVLPTVPSSFRACHHFPFLSIISNISPLENEISLGSSGDAVSMAHIQDQTPMRDYSDTYMHTTPLPCTGTLCPRPRLNQHAAEGRHLHRCLHCPECSSRAS